MKSHTEYLTFNIPARMDFVNITPQVEEIVKRSGVKEGILLCNAMHITASVFINDDEPGLHEDYKKWLKNWPRSILRLSDITTTAPAKTTPTPTQAADHGPRDRRCHHQRQARLRPVGADFLRRVRRAKTEAGAGEGNWGVGDFMIQIPTEFPDRTLVVFVRRWLKLLAAGRWQEACEMIDEPNSYGITWTRERIQQIAEDTFCPGSRFRSRHPEGIRWTDPDELGEGGDPEIFPSEDESTYLFEHNVPLNGEWSDLTALFEFHRRPQGYAVVLHDLHVL